VVALRTLPVEAVFTVAKDRKVRRRYDLPGERPEVTLSELVAEFVSDLDLKDRTRRSVKVFVERFRDHFTGDPRVDSLTTKDLLDHKRARLAKAKLKPGSINLELSYVGTMLRRAGNYFPALADWKPPPVPYEPRDTHGRERVITRDETELMLQTLRADSRGGESHASWRNRRTAADVWELATHTGMRTTELRTLEKRWVDFREGVIRLPAHVTKGKRARPVPLNVVALALLRRRCLESPHPAYVFANASASAALGETQMYLAYKRASERAGLSYGQRVEGGFRPHDNRHTTITRMLQSGADTASVAEVVGHSKQYMTLRYSHPSSESTRAAVDKLAQTEGEATETRQEIAAGNVTGKVRK